MATSSNVPLKNWPNNPNDYELGEVIGIKLQTFSLCSPCKSKTDCVYIL